MTRYQALRKIGCDPFTCWIICFLNWMVDVPEGKVGVMHIIIEYDTED